MRIKHFAGYGCVNAKKISKETVDGITTLVVEVTGDHEWGLVREHDPWLVKRWLLDRFDKSMAGSIWEFDYKVEPDYRSDIDRAVYTFTY